MANVTTMEPAPKTASKPLKNGRAKPEPEAQQEPQIKLDPRLPKIGNPAAGSNWEYIESITDDQWKNLTCYIYRTAPMIDRQAAGKEISIERIGSRFDMESIKQRHGSGRYKFILSYAPPNGGQWIRVRQFYETIFDLEKPPRVPMGEWIDNPANGDWVWAKPFLIADEAERAKQAAAQLQPDQPDPQQQLLQTLDLVEKLKGKEDTTLQAAMLKILVENSDPSKKLIELQKLMEMAKPAPAAPSSDSKLTELLLTSMMEELRDMRRRAAEMPNPMETMFGMFKQMREFFQDQGLNNPGRGKADTAAVVTETIGDIVSKTIDKAADYVPVITQAYMHGKDREVQLEQIRAQQKQNNWDWQQQPAPQQQPAVVPQVQTPPPSNMPMTPQFFAVKYAKVIERHGASIVHCFQATDGYDLLEKLLEQEGRITVDAFQKDATPQLLSQLVGMHPQLSGIFQPPEHVLQFFTELLCDPDNIPEGEEDGGDGDGPIGAAA